MHSSKEALRLPTPIAEMEADAISIMLQKHFGIDLTDSRKRHLTDNYRACAKLKDFDLTAVLKAVNKAYYSLRKDMDPVLEHLQQPFEPLEKAMADSPEKPQLEPLEQIGADGPVLQM